MKRRIVVLLAFISSLFFQESCFALGERLFGSASTRARADLESEKKNFKTAYDFIKSIDDFYSGKSLTASGQSSLSGLSKGYQGVIKSLNAVRETYLDKDYAIAKGSDAGGASKSLNTQYPGRSLSPYGASNIPSGFLGTHSTLLQPPAALKKFSGGANGLRFEDNPKTNKANDFFSIPVDKVKVEMSKISGLRDTLNAELDAVAGFSGKIKVGALAGFLSGLKKKVTSGITIGRLGSTQTKIKDYAGAVVGSLIDLIAITDQAKDILFDRLQDYANVMDQLVGKQVEITRAHAEAAKRRSEQVKQGIEEQTALATERRKAELEAQAEVVRAAYEEDAAINASAAAEKRVEQQAKAHEEILYTKVQAENAVKQVQQIQEENREISEQDRAATEALVAASQEKAKVTKDAAAEKQKNKQAAAKAAQSLAQADLQARSDDTASFGNSLSAPYDYNSSQSAYSSGSPGLTPYDSLSSGVGQSSTALVPYDPSRGY